MTYFRLTLRTLVELHKLDGIELGWWRVPLPRRSVRYKPAPKETTP